MTVAKNKLMSLTEYLSYDDGTETRHELVDGTLVEMGAEADINLVIESFLFSIFLQFVPHYCIRKGTEIAIQGNYANTRFPDLMVLTEAGVAALAGQKRSMVMFDMPAPALVVEVVSSSDIDERSRDRDYIRKREEYAKRGIAEYWIIDPIEAVVLVLTLAGSSYRETKFIDEAAIASPTFPKLTLNADEVLAGGMA